MSWTKPPADLFEDGKAITAATLNTFVRDNWLATPLGQATDDTRGGYLCSSGMQSVTWRKPAWRYSPALVKVDATWPATQDANSTTFAVGPEVTITHGGAFQVYWSAEMLVEAEDAAGDYGVAVVAPELSGNENVDYTTIALKSMRSEWTRMGTAWFYTGLQPGELTITLKYGYDSTPDNSGSASIRRKSLLVLPR